ncbi:hypothetical protein N7532_003181 [Penicillium argentinense]|uniref:Uncharacterized protein n=1 Tax=Penicillium argentinense TaxID=1131581 RepID=A0A9W9FMF8_9EURO|nr:uncharacterized protein N7532_003181 [Penicillium argentinense]KAJ5102652.1 hypothetical protein N7532_003181 [Penicillium argentinense]
MPCGIHERIRHDDWKATPYSFLYDVTESETAVGCCPSGYTCGSTTVMEKTIQTCATVIRSLKSEAIKYPSRGSSAIIPMNIPGFVTVTDSEFGTRPEITSYSIATTVMNSKTITMTITQMPASG